MYTAIKNADFANWTQNGSSIPLKTLLLEVLEQFDLDGMNAQIVQEAKDHCLQILGNLEKDLTLKEQILMLTELGENTCKQIFLMAFFTAAIAKNVEWSSARTTEYAVMGAILHSIGLNQLPMDLQRKDRMTLTAEELELYKTYCLKGAEFVRNAHIPEPVAQVILQHREMVNGQGFPNGLSSAKIYPLAKIVALAYGFTNFIIENELQPLKALREFIPNRYTIEKYEPEAIKSLIKSFVKGK